MSTNKELTTNLSYAFTIRVGYFELVLPEKAGRGLAGKHMQMVNNVFQMCVARN